MVTNITSLAANGRPERELSAKQARAIEALLVCSTVKDAAAKAGVGERTLRRWTKEDKLFIETHRQARTAAFTRDIGLLQNRVEKAIEVLDDALEGEANATQLRAAEAVLKTARDAHENVDLLEEVERLKQAFASTEADPWGRGA
jgi:hypothetical protein